MFASLTRLTLPSPCLFILFTHMPLWKSGLICYILVVWNICVYLPCQPEKIYFTNRLRKHSETNVTNMHMTVIGFHVKESMSLGNPKSADVKHPKKIQSLLKWITQMSENCVGYLKTSIVKHTTSQSHQFISSKLAYPFWPKTNDVLFHLDPPVEWRNSVKGAPYIPKEICCRNIPHVLP
jgi:hypothetical protein